MEQDQGHGVIYAPSWSLVLSHATLASGAINGGLVGWEVGRLAPDPYHSLCFSCYLCGAAHLHRARAVILIPVVLSYLVLRARARPRTAGRPVRGGRGASAGH